jgi:hypothetical protein
VQVTLLIPLLAAVEAAAVRLQALLAVAVVEVLLKLAQRL